MPGKTFGPRKPFLSIIEGTLRQKVDEKTKGAQARTYKTKDKNGKEIEATKYELTFLEWSGKIIDIRFKDTPYGHVCEVEFNDAIITIPTEGRYFQDFAQKIMSANLGQTIIFHPFDFEGDDGKNKKGVALEQNGQKLKSYYYDPKEGKSCHGIPTPQGNTKNYSKDDWKIYFLQLKKFLIAEVARMAITIGEPVPQASLTPSDEIPIIGEESEIATYQLPERQEEEDEIRLEDVPF